MVKENVQVVYSVEDKGASKKAGLLSKSFQKLKDNAKLVAVAGIGLLTATITKGLKAFGVQEKAIAQLNQSLKNQGNYSKEASKDLQAYAASLQKVTTFGDESILQGQALIASFGFQGEELKQLTAATADLAAAKGMDFVQAADLVAKAVGSETNALSRYGVQIDGAAGSTERATSAVKAMAGVFGGQAQAQALTFSGSIQQLQNAWGDLFEEIGKVFAPMVQKIATGLKSLVERFNGMSDGAKKTIVMVGVFGTALLSLLPLIAVLVPAFIAGWAAITGPIGLAIIAAGLFVTAFVKFKSLQPILAGLTVAFGIFWAAATGGILPLIAGITALVGWLLKLGGVFDSLSQKMDKNNKKIEETKEKLKEAQESGDDKAVEKLEAKLKKLEAVKKKYEEKDKVKKEEEKAGNEEDKLAKLAEQKEKEKKLELQKDQEKANALAEQKAKQKEEQDAIDKEWKEIIAEEEKAQQEEKDEAERERWLAMSEEEVNATKLTQDQKNAIILAQERKRDEERKKQVSAYAGYLAAAGEEEKDIGKAVAQGTLNWAKDGLKAKARAFGEGLIAEGLATLPMVLLGDPSPLLKMAAGASVVAGAPSAINSIQLAEGGSMIVDQPTRIGNNVLAGEAGPERIDVTPLSEQQPQTVNNIIQLDGEVLARQVLKLGQGMRSEGTVDDGL